MDVGRCKLCGLNLETGAQSGLERGAAKDVGYYKLRCRRCGHYEITLEAFNDLRDLSPFLQCATRQEYEAGRCLRIGNDNWQGLIDEHSSTDIATNRDKLLTYILRRCPRPGNVVSLDTNHDYPIIDAENSGELGWHLRIAEQDGFIEKSGIHYSLAPKGWDYLFGETGTGAIPGRCFVAMSFSEEHSPIFTDAIKPAVIAAGYNPVWMKDVLTNEDINYRMIVEIRKSQFLVADFTGMKGGVYFEAGFALGLGRSVFWATKADDLPNIHFDTNHYQHIVWKTHDELREKLQEKIVALLGYGPRKR